MNINPKNILEDINNKIRNREIFKLNREFLVKSLIIASVKTQINSYYMSIMTQNMNLVDQVIEQFRAILKFIFSADNENGEIPSNHERTIVEFSEMILEFVSNYTPIRNYLDQCIIGTRNIKFDTEKQIYFEETYDEYSNYARMLDQVKKYPNEELKQKAFNSIGNYLSINKFKPKLFKDRYFYSLMDDYRKICRLDSEIKFDHDFGDFTYNELISFCAALKIMADYYSFLFYKAHPVIERETLVFGISKLSGLSEDKVNIFLEYQTYAYEYQKDKLTLLQALIRCGNNYYFYPTTLSIGLLPNKMYRLIVDLNKEKYKKDISAIANQKAKQMTDEIAKKLKKYDLNIMQNYKLKRNNKDLAEYDMLAFDNKTNNLYICEFKWYFIGDDEKEHKRLDDKIEEAVKYRKEKNRFIINNQQSISDKLLGGKQINKIYEILISQNFSGATKHTMPVIDFETLQMGIERYDDFEELMNYFLTDEFRKTIQVDTKLFNTEIEGYKFRFYRIVMKYEE